MNITPTVVLDFRDWIYLDTVNTCEHAVHELWDHLTMRPPPSRVRILIGGARHVVWAPDLVSVLTMVGDVEIVGVWPSVVEDAASRLRVLADARGAA